MRLTVPLVFPFSQPIIRIRTIFAWEISLFLTNIACLRQSQLLAPSPSEQPFPSNHAAKEENTS